MPPSTSSTEPLQNEESGERKKATAAAASCAVPIRPAGGSSQPAGSRSDPARRQGGHARAPCRPGHTTFTRIPSLPASVPSICASDDQRALRDRVGADRGLDPDAGVGGDRHDRAAAGGAQVRQAGERVAVGRDEVRLEDRVPGLVRSSRRAEPSCRTPALRTTASRPPSSSTASDTERSTSSATVASACDEDGRRCARRRARPRSPLRPVKATAGAVRCAAARRSPRRSRRSLP